MKLYQFNGSQFTKRETFTDQPDGILITMPARYFEETGGEEPFHRAMAFVDKEIFDIWNQTISGIPKVDVPYCYLVFGGKVQYRLNILEYQRNVTKDFGNGILENKNWVLLSAPVVKAPSDFFMRGFQGFRYSAFIF